MKGHHKAAKPRAGSSQPVPATSPQPANPWLGRLTLYALPGDLLEVNGVRGFLHPGDIDRLRHYAGAVPKDGTVIEVGSCMGLSAIIMAHTLLAAGNTGARIYCVDSWDNKYLRDVGMSDDSDFYTTFLNNIQNAGVAHVITPVRKLSTEAAPAFEDGIADLLFVDADHSYEGCYADLVAWLPKLKPSGVLIGHDCSPGEGVERAAQQFTSERGFTFNVMAPPVSHYMYEVDVHAAATRPAVPAESNAVADCAPMATPVPERKKKLVGLVGVRNEERTIAQCLRAMAPYTDAIVVLDDASEDGTLAVVQSLAGECHIERVLTKSTWYRDEPGDRNRMLEVGREIGGTHFLVLDADEMLTSNCLKDGFLRRLVLDLVPGDQLAMVWIHLWRSARQYRHDNSVWTNNYKAIAFADDGCCRYCSDYTHTPRTPVDLKGQIHAVPGYAHGFMHFASVNWRNVLVRVGWYHCIERLMHPEKPAAAINALYAPAKDETAVGLADSPVEWFAGYPWFDESAFQAPSPWREDQVLSWFEKYGRAYFADLNIWDVDWGVPQSHDTTTVPVPGEQPRVVSPLMVDGQEHMRFGRNVVIGYGARLECVTSHGGRSYSPRLRIGDGTTAEMFLHIGCAGEVTIGRDCMLAGHVTIVDCDHGYDATRPLHGQPLTVAPIAIGDSVFVGEGAFIGKGVTIGERAVIGAGAVVTQDVPAYAIVGGVPAKIIGSIPRPTATRKLSTIAPPHLPDTGLTSIVIVADSGRDALDACLSSVATHTPKPHEVIVVDNGTSDGTAEYLSGEVMRRADLRVVRNETDRGFAVGVNQGLAIAGGQYVVLLGSDTLVTDGWLGHMVGHLERNPGFGAIGPTSNGATAEQSVPRGAYGSLDEMRQFAAKWVREHDGQCADVPHLDGFCLVMRRAVPGRIGGLDERLGGESLGIDDLCLRALAAGFRLAVARDSFVHQGEGGAASRAAAPTAGGWRLFREKWGLPADLQWGSAMSINLPPGDLSRFYSALPRLEDVPEPWHPLSQGEAALNGGNYEAAVAWYRRAIASFPDKLDAHVGLAVSLVASGHEAEAATGLARAIALAPTDVTLRNLLGVSLFRSGDLVAAEEALLGALALDGSDVQALVNLVHLTRAQSRYAEATEYIKRALALDASQPDALAALAGVSIELGRLDAAETALRRLELVAPEHPEIVLLRQVLGAQPTDDGNGDRPVCEQEEMRLGQA